MSEQRSSGFITPLNALRFLAAIAIVIFHYGRWSWPFTESTLQSYTLMANTGVTFFFVLSGFIMVYVYQASLRHISWPTVISFYRARIARIVPLYFIALAFTVWGMYTIRDSISPTSIILHTFFLQAWIPGKALTLNFTGWTLVVEMMFYALFPFIFAWFNRLGFKRAAWITTLIWLLTNALTIFFAFAYAADPDQANILLKFFPLLHLNSFLIGILAGQWYEQAKSPLSRWLPLGALAILIAYPLLVPANLNTASHNGLFAPLFAVFILAITQSTSWIRRALSIKPFVIGGDISYGIYILQVPVYIWTYYAYRSFGVHATLQEEGRFYLYLAILCVMAWISSVTVERWGKRLIRGTETK